MSKSINCLVLCLALLAVVAFAAPTFKLEWEQQAFYKTEYNLLKITFGGLELDDNLLTITPADKKTIEDVTWQIKDDQWSYMPLMYGSSIENQSLGCWDSTTKQITAWKKMMYGTSNTLEITLADSIYDAEDTIRDATYTIICPVLFDVVNLPTMFDMVLTADSNIDDWTPMTTSLAIPADMKYQPDYELDFKSATFKQEKSSRFSSTQLDLEFSTNVPGPYRIKLINGPSFSDFNLNNGKFAEYYCSTKDNKSFARLVTMYGQMLVFVPTGSKEIIKCTIFIDNEPSVDIVRSERSSITIELEEALVARTLDYSLVPAYVQASASVDSDDVSIRTRLRQISSSSTPINTNSTVEFIFSSHIDVTQYGQVDQEYRGFECEDDSGYVYSTISFDQHTITLKDIDRHVVGYLQCTFHLLGSNPVDFSKNIMNMATVTVKVDGTALTARHAPGNAEPIYFTATVSIEPEQVVVIENDKHSITDTFVVRDSYQSTYNTLRNPVALFTIDSGQLFSDEAHKDQLKCTTTTPTSTKPVDLKLEYLAEFAAFRVELKDLIGVETFHITIVCSRSIPKITAYGLDVTPASTLVIQVIELVDKKRFYEWEAQASTRAANIAILPKVQPSGASYPAQQVGTASIEQSVIVPSTKSYTQVRTDAQKVVDTISQLIASTKYINDDTTGAFADLKNIKALFKPSTEFSTAEFETSLTHGPDKWDRYIDELGNFAVFFDINDDLNLYNVAQEFTPSSLFRETVLVSQQFTYEQSDEADSFDDWSRTAALQRAVYKQYMTVVRDADTILESDSSIRVNELYFANPAASCGFESQRFKIARTSKYNELSTVNEPTAADQWTAFAQTYGDETNNLRTWVSCQLGETCKYNIDCASDSQFGSVVCRAGVCTGVPRSEPPYVEYSYDNSKFSHDQYYNSASMLSFIGTIAVVIVAMLF